MEPSIPKKNNKKWFLWLTAMIFATVLIAFLTLGIFILNQEGFYRNIFVESVDISNLSKEEAMVKLEKAFNDELKHHKISLTYQGKNWEYPYGQLGFRYDFESALEEAYGVGREGNPIARLAEIVGLRKNPKIISLQSEYNSAKVEEVLEELNNEIFQQPVDAKLKRTSDNFVIIKEINGVALDTEELLDRIKEQIETFENRPIELPVTYLPPRITEDKLSQLDGVIGSFGTTFDARVKGRSTNIAIASDSINGTLLMPGEAFSFNEQTGPRGVDEGYQEAPVILNGQLIPGIGGGICQVSTTLYNAVVRADLEITNRRNHSLPVAYVPLGHDATVSYGFIDFQFVNDMKYPIYVESLVKGNRVSINLYGKKAMDTSIKLHSEVVETIEPKVEIKNDDTLFSDETKVEIEPKRGYRVNTYKIYLKSGKEIKRELISKDYYIPVNGVTLQGTKARPEENTKEVIEEVLEEGTKIDETDGDPEN